jgi:hypothetical protein
LAGTYDGTTVTVYVDGFADGSYTPTGGTVSNSNTAPIQIGGLDDTGSGGFFTGNYLLGDVDEVRLWSSALTEAELQTEMNTDIVASTGTLVGHWNFDGGTVSDEVSATVGILRGRRASSRLRC